MKLPGLLAALTVFRKVGRELERVNQNLERLTKVIAIAANVPLSKIDEIAESEESEESAREDAITAAAEPGSSVMMQDEADFALLDRLEKTYREIHGQAPPADLDLEGLTELREKLGREL